MPTSGNDSLSGYRPVWQECMGAVDQGGWNRLALAASTPFLEWEWLELLESSGSIAPHRGWNPQHLTVWHHDRLVAAAPFYIKQDSEAEFVFDQPWAEAAAQIGAAYYPKLVGAVPVTPLGGYRFLIAPEHDAARLTRLMVHWAMERCRVLGLGGCHLLFVDPDACASLIEAGFQAWHHHGFIWQNKTYSRFEDFLERFTRNQRRNIRRERRRLARSGIRVDTYTGQQIPEDFFSRMHQWYVHTNERYGPWGGRYLTSAFFTGLAHRWRHRLLFTAGGLASDPTAPPVGMAMLVYKGKRLYGRYWGGDPRVPLLHFEACYYLPIAWAIDKAIETFDPGMGGAHKLRRGFVSHPTLSLHRFTDPRLAAVMEANIGRINRFEDRQIETLNAAMPLRT